MLLLMTPWGRTWANTVAWTSRPYHLSFSVLKVLTTKLPNRLRKINRHTNLWRIGEIQRMKCNVHKFGVAWHQTTKKLSLISSYFCYFGLDIAWPRWFGVKANLPSHSLFASLFFLAYFLMLSSIKPEKICLFSK
jgi:hypothetical protein